MIPLLTLYSFSLSAKGLVNTFKELSKNQKANYLKEVQNHVNQDFNINSVQNIQDIEIAPAFLKIVMLHTPHRYFQLIQKDKCSLYDLLQTKLVKFPSNDYKQVLFSFKDTMGNKQIRSLVLSDFMDKVAYKQCPNVRTIQKYFTLDNLRSTLSQIKLIDPVSADSCINELEAFNKDVKTPYLCGLAEEIKNAKQVSLNLRNSSRSDFKKRNLLSKDIKRIKSLQKILSPKALEILNGRCDNLENTVTYCTSFFKKGIWGRLLNNQKISTLKDFYCGKRKTKNCIKEKNNKEHSCNYPNFSGTFLAPLADCSELSSALTYSRFKLNLNDCPANSGNEALTTFSRVLNNFQFKNQFKSCELNSIMPFVNFDKKHSDMEHWDISLCYLNPLLDNKKVCMKTVFGDVPDDKLSLSKNMTKILSKLKGYSGKDCKVLSQTDYKPTMLEYQNGCHIITDKRGCRGTTCKFKVMLGEAEFSKYTLESNLRFELIPVDFLNEKNALIKILEAREKKSLKQIKNISSFKYTFNQFPNAIFMGVGCLEDLYPRFYKVKYLNECHYMPFLIDGIIEDRDIYSLTLRTSLDHIHAPRVVPWKRVFNSIKNFQKYHPTKLWSLNAIY